MHRAGRIEAPALVVNFKTFPNCIGARGLSLARLLESLRDEYGIYIGIAPQHLDLPEIADSVTLPTFSQNVEPFGLGRYTGALTPEAVKDKGGDGTIVNHPERGMNLNDMHAVVKRCRELDLQVIACASNRSIALAIGHLNPTAIAIEPPGAIGSKTNVLELMSESIEGYVQAIRKIHDGESLLCGGGLKAREDLAQAIQLGFDGVLVGGVVFDVADVKKKATDLVEGLRASCEH